MLKEARSGIMWYSRPRTATVHVILPIEKDFALCEFTPIPHHATHVHRRLDHDHRGALSGQSNDRGYINGPLHTWVFFFFPPASPRFCFHFFLSCFFPKANCHNSPTVSDFRSFALTNRHKAPIPQPICPRRLYTPALTGLLRISIVLLSSQHG